jgi:YHS domain-containing protein
MSVLTFRQINDILLVHCVLRMITIFPRRVERVQTMRKTAYLGLMLSVALSIGVSANGADKADKNGPKCPVSNKPIGDKTHAVAYKDGQVYFCCDNCPKAFAADTAKFAAKANAQLVVTSQYKQTKCPLSGEAVNAKQHLKVAGVTVEFCCPDCKAKVKEAKKEAKVNLVFDDENFKKGFEKVKTDEKK